MDGERGRTRTFDPCLKRALLYQLSYAPTHIQFNIGKRVLADTVRRCASHRGSVTQLHGYLSMR